MVGSPPEMHRASTNLLLPFKKLIISSSSILSPILFTIELLWQYGHLKLQPPVNTTVQMLFG